MLNAMSIERHGFQLFTGLWLILGPACHDRAKNTAPSESNSSAEAQKNNEYVAPDSAGRGRVGGLKFLEIIKGDAPPTDALPMAVFLHGYGDGAQDVWLSNVKVPMRVVMFESPRSFNGSFTWMYSPIGDGRSEWLAHTVRKAGEELAHAVKLLATHRPTRGRAIVSGFSQGAVVAYYLATYHPTQVHGAVPIAGLLPKPLWPSKLSTSHPWPAIHAIHGEHDKTVLTASAQETVAHLARLGQPATLHVYRDIGHKMASTMRSEMQAKVEAFAREIAGDP